MKSLVIFPILVIISVILVFFYCKLVKRFNIMPDRPNQRSSHNKEIPRGGGIVVVLVVLSVALAFLGIVSGTMLGYVIGGIVIALVGFLDDIIGLKGIWKIIGMASASIVPLAFGMHLNYLNIIADNQILLYILSFIWIYGMINAFNFMDGIDGLVSGTSAIYSFFLIIISVITGNYFVAMVALATLCSCIGFLAFNINPASVFLGDVGSMFLGYNFAVLSILLVNQSSNQVPIYIFIVLYSAIIYDSMVTFVKRGLQGKEVLKAHREHLYQRLIIFGMGHRDVSMFYYILCLILGLMSLVYLKVRLFNRIMLAFMVLVILIGFSAFVRYVEANKARNG